MSKYEIKAKGKNSAEVLIFGDIGASWFDEGVEAKNVAKEIQGLDVETLDVRINSYGGSVADGLAIYNAFKRHSASVNVYVEGVAVSIASLIAMSGEKIYMAENAMMMIHAPWGAGVGNAKELREKADVLDKYAEAMASSYATKSGKSVDEIEALLKDGADHWYTAAEAVEAGFADEISNETAIAASGFKDSKFFAGLPVNKGGLDKKPSPIEKDAAVAVARNKEEVEMPPEKQEKATVKAEAEKVNAAKVQADIKAAEKKRREEIKMLFTPFISNAALKQIMDDCLDDMDITLEQAREKALDKLGEGKEPLAKDPRIDLVKDVTSKIQDGVVAAMSHRCGIEKDDTRNEFRGMTLMEIGKHALQARGVDIRGLDKMTTAGEILAHSSSDFPLLLANTANKVLQAAYEAFPSTYQMWCDIGQVSDFKSNARIRLGSFNSLDEIKEKGEYTLGTIGEEQETIQAVTKGKMINFTRQMIINDDLGGFNRITRWLGRAAARTVNSDAYGVLNANGNMSDGIALFHSSHNNLAGSGAVIGSSTISAGKAAMRKQLDPNSNDYLNIMPVYLLVPVAKEDDAKTFISSESDFSSSNSKKKNIHQNSLEVISDPYLDATSVTAWYLVSSPMEAPLVEVAFLDGNRSPYLESQTMFNRDGISWKVRLDYGFAAIDWRAGYKNPGA